MWSRFIAVAVVWLVATGIVKPAPATLPAVIDHEIQDISVAELEANIEMLASDGLSGRGLGHLGNQQAELYIAHTLQDEKVPPAVPEYFQPVQVYQPRLGPAAILTITEAGRSLADLRAGADFMPLPESGDRTADGPLRFVGHGISAAALHHDDYAGIDAKGAVVLAIDGAPETLLRSAKLSSDDRADIAGIDRKVDDARAHGAAGLIVIKSSTSDKESLFPSNPSVRSATYRLYGAMHDLPLAVAAISESAAGRRFASCRAIMR